MERLSNSSNIIPEMGRDKIWGGELSFTMTPGPAFSPCLDSSLVFWTQVGKLEAGNGLHVGICSSVKKKAIEQVFLRQEPGGIQNNSICQLGPLM